MAVGTKGALHLLPKGVQALAPEATAATIMTAVVVRMVEMRGTL